MATVQRKSVELEITAQDTFTDPILIEEGNVEAQIFVVGTGAAAPQFATTVVTIETKPLDPPAWVDAEYVPFATVQSDQTPPEQSQIIRPATRCFLRAGVADGDFNQSVKIRLTV